MAGTVLVLFVAGASTSAAIQLAMRGDLTAFASANFLDGTVRSLLLRRAGGVGLLVCLVAGLVLSRHRSRASLEAVARIARIVSPLTLALALPLLLQPLAFVHEPLVCAVGVTLFGLALERTLRVSFAALPRMALPPGGSIRTVYPRLSKWAPLTVTIALASLYAVYFSYYTVLRHYRLETHSFDLGIFDNMMWNLLRAEWFKATPGLGLEGSHIQNHATFSAYLLAPLYALRQKADTLLVIQATVCGATAIPLYLLAKRRFANGWAALALALAYVVYAPMHGAIFHDFHFLTMAPFWVVWVLYLFESHRRGWLVVVWLAAVLLREEVSAGLAMAFLFYLFAGKRPYWALAGAVSSAVYFVLVKFVIIPAHHSQPTSVPGFVWMFGDLIPAGEEGFGAVLRTLASNPTFVLKSLLTEQKLVYVAQLLGPLLLLPARNARTWLLLAVPAMFTLLATSHEPLTDTHFQYSANWACYVFVAVAVAVGMWRVRPSGGVRMAAALTALVVTSVLFSYHYGAVLNRSTFRGGSRPVVFHMTAEHRMHREHLYGLIAKIPAEASVAATETEVPHVSAREDCLTLRFGHGDAEYLLVDRRWVRGGPSRDHLRAALETGQYGFVEARGRFGLWAKGFPPTRNDEGARFVGLP